MFKEFNRLFNQNPLQTNIWETDEVLIAEYSQLLELNNDRLEKKYLEALEQTIQEAYEVGRLLYNHMHSSLYSEQQKISFKFKSFSDLPISGIAERLSESLNEGRLFNINEAFAIIKTIANIQNETNKRFFDVKTFELKYNIKITLNSDGLLVEIGEKKKIAEIKIILDKQN